MMQFLIDNILLILIIVVSAFALFWPSFNSRRYGPEVTPQQATELINRKNAQIVDVRKAADYAKGHIARAKNMPASQIQNMLGELDKKRPVLLVDRTGAGSRPVAKLLRGVGFDQVYILENGLLGWRKAEMPLD